jgi:hypothetical protein
MDVDPLRFVADISYALGFFMRVVIQRCGILHRQIDSPGCFASVFIVRLNRFSRRAELKYTPANSSSMSNVFPPAIVPLPEF